MLELYTWIKYLAIVAYGGSLIGFLILARYNFRGFSALAGIAIMDLLLIFSLPQKIISNGNDELSNCISGLILLLYPILIRHYIFSFSLDKTLLEFKVYVRAASSTLVLGLLLSLYFLNLSDLNLKSLFSSAISFQNQFYALIFIFCLYEIQDIRTQLVTKNIQPIAFKTITFIQTALVISLFSSIENLALEQNSQFLQWFNLVVLVLWLCLFVAMYLLAIIEIPFSRERQIEPDLDIKVESPPVTTQEAASR